MWFVMVPAGRWMTGVYRFRTKAKAERFMAMWNDVEGKAGGSPLAWTRSAHTFVGSLPAAIVEEDAP